MYNIQIYHSLKKEIKYYTEEITYSLFALFYKQNAPPIVLYPSLYLDLL